MKYSVGPTPLTPGDHIKAVKDELGTRYYVKQYATAYEGPCIVFAQADPLSFDEDSQSYESRLLFYPSWRVLFNCAIEQQKATRDFHHDFFEGYQIRRREIRDGVEVAVLELILGS